MQTLALLLVAAATTGGGWYSKPYVGGKKLFRHDAVVDGPAPPGGPMIAPGAGGPGMAGMPGGPMGPDGVGGPGASQPGRRFPNVRSQVIFLDPRDMKIAWQTGGGPAGERAYTPGLVVPDRYNFLQGYIYRLKISDIQGRPGVSLYPTIEVAPSTPITDAYLTHNAIPVQFTAEDFDQVIDGGNFVTKVIYLPDPKFQELAVPGGPETLISTRLEPGVDPILEADKRGTILLIVRLGGINLELAPSGVVVGPTTINSVPVDAAPAPTVIPGPSTVVPGPSTAIPPAAVEPIPAPVAPVGVGPAVPAPAPAPATVTPPAPAPAPAPEPAPVPPATTPAPVPPATTPAPEATTASLPAPAIEPAPSIPPIEPPQPILAPGGGN